MQKVRHFIVLVMVLLASNSALKAAEMPVILPMSISLNVNKVFSSIDPANNSPTFTVMYAENDMALQKEHILVYVDNHYVTEFKECIFPYSFQYNLKGYGTGNHEVRVDVTDRKNSEIVLGRASVYVRVQ